MQLYAKQLHENAEKAEQIISESENNENKGKDGQKLEQFYRWVEEDEKFFFDKILVVFLIYNLLTKFVKEK